MEIKFLKPVLFCPSFKRAQEVPISMGTSVTDVVINSLDASDFEHVSQSRKAVCYFTHTRSQVQSQQLEGGIVKTTKPVTL